MAQIKRWRPEPFVGKPEQWLDELNVATRVGFDNVYGLEQTSLQTVKQGLRYADGVVSVTGQKLQLPTGLATVSTVVAIIEATGTFINETVQVRPSPQLVGSIDVYVFQATGAASTVPRNIHFHAVGT